MGEKSKDRKDRGKSSLSLDSQAIFEKIDKIGEELLKQKPFIDSLSKKLESQLKKALKNDERLLSKQTNPVTGIQGCILEDDKSIDIKKAKLDIPFIKPKMSLDERKSIIENMRKENQKKFATVYSSDRNSPIKSLDESLQLKELLNEQQLIQDL